MKCPNCGCEMDENGQEVEDDMENAAEAPEDEQKEYKVASKQPKSKSQVGDIAAMYFMKDSKGK